tara:strand:- start:8224 stop:8382 length:159 start_codon:yes stop_codon:yes gene_type:complete
MKSESESDSDQEKCEHELKFEIYSEPWFIHFCRKCEKTVYSNRVIEDLGEDE